MEFGLAFFCLCLLLNNGSMGHSFEGLVDKVQNLEAKFEIMSDTVAKLTSENEDLRSRLRILEGMINNHDDKHVQSLQVSETKDSWVNETEEPVNIEPKTSREMLHDKNRKRIVPPTSSPTGVIAFHAYISTDQNGPFATHHILQFDVVTLNRGNGYTVFDGIFIVPASGTYVFTWANMADTHGVVYTQLMRNSNVIGRTYADSASTTVWDFSTGVVVVDVVQGDHVYVRLGTASKGTVRSINGGTTTFSGWLLS